MTDKGAPNDMVTLAHSVALAAEVLAIKAVVEEEASDEK